jgi:hypothetical protein
MDIANDPAAMKAFAALPLSAIRPPVVQVGDQWVHAAPSLDKVCTLLGIDPPVLPEFTPEELYRRLNAILEASVRYVLAFPPDKLHTVSVPRRPRNARDLAYHIFMIPLDFMEATDEGKKWRSGAIDIPDEVQTPQDIATAGEAVRARLATWYAARTPDFWPQPMTTHWATMSLHEYFMRTTWHSGQHSRQLAALLESIDITPPDKLPHSIYEGLPMPQRLWE